MSLDNNENKITNKSHLRTVFLTVILDMIGVGILIPIIPYLFDPTSVYYILDGSYNYSNTYLYQGLALAIYPLFQFLFTPILGELSDHYGRKKLLLLSLIGTLIGNLLTAYAILTHSFILFIIGRIIDGATAGNISVAMASIADVSENRDKAKNFGMIGAAFGIGFIIGPALGGIISEHFGLDMPFWFSALLCFVNILLVIYTFRESLRRSDGIFSIHPSAAIRNVLSGFRTRDLRNIFTVNLLWVSAFTFYTSFAGVYLKERFGFGLDQIGYYFAYVGVCIAITQGFLIKHIFAKYSDKDIIRISLATFVFIIFTFILSHNLMINLLLVPIFTICIAMNNTGISSVASKKASPAVQGRIIGITSSLQAIGSAVPSMIAGAFAARLGYVSPLYITIALSLTAIYFMSREK